MMERVILPIIDEATQLVPHSACMISAATSYVAKGSMTLPLIMERSAFRKDEIERSEAAGLDAPAQTGLDATQRWHRQFDARIRVGNVVGILLSARDAAAAGRIPSKNVTLERALDFAATFTREQRKGAPTWQGARDQVKRFERQYRSVSHLYAALCMFPGPRPLDHLLGDTVAIWQYLAYAAFFQDFLTTEITAGKARWKLIEVPPAVTRAPRPEMQPLTEDQMRPFL